jgi:hypothetical protein
MQSTIDTNMPSGTATSPSPSEIANQSYDLCIVGGGMCGLNALFAATRYLTKQSRVLLIDRGKDFGGMWGETYDYVRLHQPHPMFTAGNIPWTLGKKPEHLATKAEVLAHIQECMEQLRQKVTLVEMLGCEYVCHTESEVDGDNHVDVFFHPLGSQQPQLQIRTKLLVKAFGFRVPINDPIKISSLQVHSVAPQDALLKRTDDAHADKPVYVVGGGKTGMDTAHELIKRYPGRKIYLLVGKGTVFTNRNHAFPTGLRRWWGGNTSVASYSDIAMRFNGDNAAETMEYYKQRYSVNLDGGFKHFMLGVLSEEENTQIKKGIAEVICDYLTDVIDVEGAPTAIFRSGEKRKVEPGSVIVNCTGYVLRQPHEYEPYLSESGSVISIQPTSSIHVLTTFAAYFLVHLHYLGKLKTLPLYELDQQTLIAQDKQVSSLAAMVQLLFNTMVIIDAVPMRVMDECGLDYDRWYPLHRRIIGFIKLKINHGKYTRHIRQSLDRVRDRTQVHCGVLPSVQQRIDREKPL